MQVDETTDDNRVLIVGGRFAEGIALNYGFYSCQEDRKFKTAKYMAFYFNKRISHYFEIVDGSKKVNSRKREKKTYSFFMKAAWPSGRG